MIMFDLLKISDKGKEMYVSFHVNRADYFQNIYLESLTIMTADQVSETDPLTSTANYIYKYDFPSGMKEYETVLDKGSFDAAYNNWNPNTGEAIDSSKPYATTSFDAPNLSKDLFFVYVKCAEGVIIGCPPCRLDELTTLGVTFDENILHQKVLGYTQELVDECTVPQGFTDFILTWQAFNSAVESEHYIPAIKYWKRLFDSPVGYGGYIGNKGNCGCHGKNRL